MLAFLFDSQYSFSLYNNKEGIWWRLVADIGPCEESFDGVTGYVPRDFSQGQMVYGARSAVDCEQACRRNATCNRFVFITDTQLIGDPNRVCYLFASRLAEFIERPGGTIYFRRKCLPLDTCAVMTTTSKSPLHSHCTQFIDTGSGFLDPTQPNPGLKQNSRLA